MRETKGLARMASSLSQWYLIAAIVSVFSATASIAFLIVGQYFINRATRGRSKETFSDAAAMGLGLFCSVIGGLFILILIIVVIALFGFTVIAIKGVGDG